MFLYKQVYEDLKHRIQKGEYLRDGLLPSEREIGEIYQVDRTTVRKALQLLVDDKLAEKRPGKGTMVIWRPDAPNAPYTPGATNNPGTTNTTNTPDVTATPYTSGAPLSASQAASPAISAEHRGSYVAFFLPKGGNNSSRITQPFYAQLFYTVEQECQKHGYSLIYSTLNESDNLDQLLSAHQYAGIFFISNVDKKHLDRALELNIPSVMVNGSDRRMPSILSDNFSGTYDACRYLIESGHTEIGIVNGNANYITNKDRLHGVVMALQKSGLTLKEEYCLGGDSWEFESALASVEHMLRTQSSYPTALIAFNDRLALGAIQAIQQAGLKVPDDISIIGYDNSDQAKYSIPQITTVETHIPIIGKTAASLLFQQIQGETVYPIKVLTPVELITKASVRDLTK